MKRNLILAAAALFLLSAFPASAQLYWGMPGSAGIVDESSSGLYEFTNATLRFKSGQTGTIVVRYPVAGIDVENPDFNSFFVSYGYGPGVSVKLMRVLQCSGYVEEIASWGPGTDTSANTCNEIDISTHTWDLYGTVYYFEVTLTRSSTATNPQLHSVQLHG